MKTIAPRLFLLAFLLPAQWLLAQSGLTVEKATELLKILKQEQPVPTLIAIPDSNTQANQLPASMKFMGSSFSAETNNNETVNFEKYPLLLPGRYRVSNTGYTIQLKLIYRDTFDLGDIQNNDSSLILENTPFGIRYYLELAGSNPRDPITYKTIIYPTPTKILSLLSIAAGLVKKHEIGQMDAARWQNVSMKLEENPFIVNQLGGIRFSMLPLDHPLTHSVVQALNTQTQHFFNDFVMDAAILSAEVPGDYFSLQDIEASYRQPVLADANAELRAAGDRIQVRRQTEGGLDATAIMTGLTDFVLERAKEEFSVSFLERMRTDFMRYDTTSFLGKSKDRQTGFIRYDNTSFLGKSKDRRFEIRELQLLFPKTCSFLSTKADLSNYKSLLPMARREFILDLRDLGLNIHRLLELPQYKNLQNSGELFHLALFYEIASMAYQGIAVDNITNNILTRLERREKDLFKQENFELANQHTYDSLYTALQEAMEMFDSSLYKLSESIDQQKEKADSTIDACIDTLFLSSDSRYIEDQQNEFRNFYPIHLQTIAQKDLQFFPWVTSGQFEQMRNIPKLLKGRRYYDHLQRYPSLDQYEQHFSSTPDSTLLKASGIELTKKLVGTLPDGTDMTNFLVEYYRYWLDVEKQAAEMIRRFDEENDTLRIQSNERILTDKQKTYGQRLNRGIDTLWSRKPDSLLLEDDLKALKYLAKAFETDTLAISDSLTSQQARPAIQAIQRKNQDIEQGLKWVETRLKNLEQKTDSLSPLLDTVQQWLAEYAPAPAPGPQQPTFLDTILDQRRKVQQILENIDTLYVPTLDRALKETQQMKKVVSLAAVLISCLKADPATSNGNRYIDPKTFRGILSQDRSRDFFLGITMQRLQGILQPDSASAISQKNVAAATNKFVDIIFEMQQQRDSLNNMSNGKLKFNDYFPLVRGTMDLLNTLIQIKKDDEQFNILYKAPLITDQTLSMFENIQAERYGSALFNLVELFTLVSEASNSAKMRWNALRSDLIRYGSFMANVASAQTADEVKAALLAVALPPGSSRVKREDVFNVALNTYLGLSVGRETLNTPGPARPRAASVGLSLPVGISTSWKFKREHKMSYSALLSILDLGAIASFRLGDNAAQDLPELKFENFVAPGGYFVANFPKSPFSLGVGAQYGPQVRKITFGIDELQSSAWRLAAFAAIDVPVFNFVSKKGKVKVLK